MEMAAVILIPVLMAVVLIRALLLPIRLIWKLAIHSLCGLVCLWIVNGIAPFTGIAIPVNPLTAAAVGVGGIPAMILLALLWGM